MLIFLVAFLQFYPVVSRNGKIHYSVGSLFFCWLSLSLVIWSRLGDRLYIKIPNNFVRLVFKDRFCSYGHYYYYYYYYFTPSNFSKPILIGSFSLEFEWQQVFSDRQDPLTYSSPTQQVWIVSILPLISNSSIFFSKDFGDSSKHSNNNWYHHHLHVPQLS